MSFMCPHHRRHIEGKNGVNTKHKCFKCDGTGRKCLVGYEAYLIYCKAEYRDESDRLADRQEVQEMIKRLDTIARKNRRNKKEECNN